jgi:PEGA domain-containing protein
VRRATHILLIGLGVLLLPSAARAQWYPPPFPYRYYPIDVLRSSVRVEVQPNDAEVFVDGYYAGVVDDFDGAFQRLRLPPGQHEIVVRRDGYHSVKEDLYLTPDTTHHIRRRLEPLAAGEPNDPRPTPLAPPPGMAQPGQAPPPNMPPPGYPGARRPSARRMPPPEAPPPPEAAPSEPSSFGVLVVRVQPADAEILVDGERWRGPAGEERLVIQLPEGPHRIEIQKDGFERFTSDVQVRRGETSPLNVSLSRRQ